MFGLARKLRKELLRPVRKWIAATVEQATARQREQIDDLAARDRARQEEIDRLRSQCQALSAENSGLRDQIGATSAHFEQRLAAEIGAHHENLLGAETELQARLDDRILRLEQLVTGTAAARPPGARSAAKALEAPAVAVIIPTFNRPKFLPEAIESVQRQTFQDWRLVIVGDGSGPETEAAVAPFLDDPRIAFIPQTRSGSANARTRGISETSAQLIAYLDDDNLWYPDFLARAVDCMASNPTVDVLYGALVTQVHGLDRSCILWMPFDRERLLAGNFIDTSVIVHRRALVDRYGGWDSSVNRLCDWDLMLRYTAEKPAYALDALAAVYRVCDDRRTSALIPEDATRAEILRRAVSAPGAFPGS